MKKEIIFIIAFFTFLIKNAFAHPMPNSLVLLNLQDDKVNIELQLPVQEFELAYGKNLHDINDVYIKENFQKLSNYILAHIALKSKINDVWKTSVVRIKLDSVQSELNGVYKELIYEITCFPKTKNETRNFTLQYDAIIHQVVSHFAIVKISQDFNNGIVPLEPSEIGIIQLDIASNTVKPFTINVDEGSKWNGFKKLITLGMHHIKNGIDHLLFLLVVLLISPIVVSDRQWKGFGGNKYALLKILKVVTAFTIGHSFALILVSFFPIPYFSQSIEVAISITILISAIHTIKPIFPNKETVSTFVFGLIHGCAFASTLYNLHLNTSLKILSVLGFNLGIEIMQLQIILLFIPLLLLSKFSFYKYIRISGGLLAIIASVAWIVERLTHHENTITGILNNLTK